MMFKEIIDVYCDNNIKPCMGKTNVKACGRVPLSLLLQSMQAMIHICLTQSRLSFNSSGNTLTNERNKYPTCNATSGPSVK
jgi:hypothetical protein